jgi:periplasmic mercuric ion binding protein
MRTNTILSTVLILILFLAQSAVMAQKKDQYRVVKLQTSAHTENCKAKIEYTLAYEKGIVKSELNIETQILEVTYKPKKTDINKIIKVINKLGHEAVEIFKKQVENNKE